MTPQPDIVFMVCHDLGRHLSVDGESNASPPALERLAREGVVFDLRSDPLERRSVAAMPEANAARARCRQALEEWQRRTDDPLRRVYETVAAT
jgi:hypothetical protein